MKRERPAQERQAPNGQLRIEDFFDSSEEESTVVRKKAKVKGGGRKARRVVASEEESEGGETSNSDDVVIRRNKRDKRKQASEPKRGGKRSSESGQRVPPLLVLEDSDEGSEGEPGEDVSHEGGEAASSAGRTTSSGQKLELSAEKDDEKPEMILLEETPPRRRLRSESANSHSDSGEDLFDEDKEELVFDSDSGESLSAESADSIVVASSSDASASDSDGSEGPGSDAVNDAASDGSDDFDLDIPDVATVTDTKRARRNQREEARSRYQNFRKGSRRWAGDSVEDNDEEGEISAENDPVAGAASPADSFIVDDSGEEPAEEWVAHMTELRERNVDFRTNLRNYVIYIIYLLECPEIPWMDHERVLRKLPADLMQSLTISPLSFQHAVKMVNRNTDDALISMLGSSAWLPDFRQAIETYPFMEMESIEGKSTPCDACTIGGHRYASQRANFKGNPYSRWDFSDNKDEMKENEVTTFNLGRFCADRATFYHYFRHWGITMRDSLDYELQRLSGRIRDPEGIPKLTKKQRKKKKYKQVVRDQLELHIRNAIYSVDVLTERNMIETMVQDYITQLDSAKETYAKGNAFFTRQKDQLTGQTSVEKYIDR